MGLKKRFYLSSSKSVWEISFFNYTSAHFRFNDERSIGSWQCYTNAELT